MYFVHWGFKALRQETEGRKWQQLSDTDSLLIILCQITVYSVIMLGMFLKPLWRFKGSIIIVYSSVDDVSDN